MDWDNRDENYRLEIIHYIEEANNDEGLTREQIEHLEALMRID